MKRLLAQRCAASIWLAQHARRRDERFSSDLDRDIVVVVHTPGPVVFVPLDSRQGERQIEGPVHPVQPLLIPLNFRRHCLQRRTGQVRANLVCALWPIVVDLRVEVSIFRLVDRQGELPQFLGISR